MKPIDDALLRAWPLPMPEEGDGKNERGRVLVVAGSREMPGAAVLAAHAAFRAGAGKVALGVVRSVATQVGLAVPEARVIALPETEVGGIATSAHRILADEAPKVDALLIGPGMVDTEAACGCVAELLPAFGHSVVILDAAAMDVVRAGDRCIGRFDRPVLLTPHPGEMAHLTGMEKAAITADLNTVARSSAARWNAFVALKSATTVIAAPDGRTWRHEGGNVGLGASGSGDVLSGIIAGLAARGASIEQACAWAVALHARSGERLARRMGTLGYLAREIADEVPALMEALANAA